MMETQLGANGCQPNAHFRPPIRTYTRTSGAQDDNTNNSNSDSGNSRNRYHQRRQEESELGCGDADNADNRGDSGELAELFDRPASDPTSNSSIRLAANDLNQIGPSSQQHHLATSAGPNQLHQQLRLSCNQEDQADPSKHHVGPVMGIFFKVWSLVKVTKGRQQQKLLRRQNSENTGQFQFVSGDQLGSALRPSASGAARQLGASSSVAMLHEGHFRRAGSQPAPSLGHGGSSGGHHASSSNNPNTSNYNHQHRLQVMANSSDAPATTGAGTATTASTTTTTTANTRRQRNLPTSNSSSGVSSTTSSTLADSILTTSGGPLVSPAKRDAPRRSDKSTRVQPSAGSYPVPMHAPSETKSSWTSRIKRGAKARTTISNHDQVASSSSFRYHSRREPALATPPARHQNNNHGGFHWPRRTSQAQSDTNHTDVQPPRHWMRRKETESHDNDETDLADAMTLQAAAGQRADGSNDDHCKRNTIAAYADEDEDYGEYQEDQEAQDSDTNDIYSTPNDSIQSVPNSAAPTVSNADQAPLPSSIQPWFRQQISNGHERPMIKSFSATSFVQLASASKSQQHQQDASNSSHLDPKGCKPIVEQSELRLNNDAKFPLEADLGADLNDSNTTNATRLQATAPALGPAKRLSNGSRFFISSSSSEESNPSQQQQLRQQQPVDPMASVTTAISHHQPAALDKQNVKLPIQFGLHYHDPQRPANDMMLVTRPDTLIIEPTPLASKKKLIDRGSVGVTSTFVSLAGPLATPSGNAFAGQCPSIVAAVSPAMAPPSSFGLGVGARINPNAASGYKKSPSLFEMSNGSNLTRFSSRFPLQTNQQQPVAKSFALTSFQPLKFNHKINSSQTSAKLMQERQHAQVPNSISLQDCKSYTNCNDPINQQSESLSNNDENINQEQDKGFSVSDVNQFANDNSIQASEYKLTQILLESGSNPSAKDQYGCTALMHAVLSENIAALKCLIEFGVDLNDTNHAGLSALDLVTSKAPTEARIEMLKLLIDNRADLDKTRQSDGTRLLDRLIFEHGSSNVADKMLFIDCLLHNGAKLGSSTWLAANGKHEIQLRLLRKLCQDGYFLYKKSSIEAAVYRFEYALKRIAELEQQLLFGCCRFKSNQVDDQSTIKVAQQIKYQTYLGLSRCERKRGFYKRALEFAHMSILVDSTSYEGYYSKAHILKDLGEIDESMLAIDQTSRLVDKSIELIKSELNNLQHQEESIIFDGCFNMHDPGRSCRIEANRNELIGNLEYLEEAKKHIARLRKEIMESKLSIAEP